MLAQVVLIIDSRKELSLKYKKIVQQDSYIYPIIAHNSQEAFDKIEKFEPDLIIISDSLDANINNLCQKILTPLRRRTKNSLYRPVVIILSKSSYLEDRLEGLRSGADDFLSEPIDPSEFSLRIFAHLRRHIEEAFLILLPNYLLQIFPAKS